MEATAAFARTTARPISVLGRLTMAALVGLALALIYVQANIVKNFDMPLTIFSVVMLATAGMISIGWRWTPLLGALLSALIVAGKIEPVIYDLSHPESFHLFTFMVVAVALAAVGFVSGISATIQNYRSDTRFTPPAMVPSLAVVAGLCIGGVLVASLPRESGAAVSPELLASLPAIGTPGMHFDQTALKAKVGETVALRFDNSHSTPHSFDLDELNVHVPAAAGQQSLIMFKPTSAGSYTYYCAIPGHREAGMVGTLTVEP